MPRFNPSPSASKGKLPVSSLISFKDRKQKREVHFSSFKNAPTNRKRQYNILNLQINLPDLPALVPESVQEPLNYVVLSNNKENKGGIIPEEKRPKRRSLRLNSMIEEDFEDKDDSNWSPPESPQPKKRKVAQGGVKRKNSKQVSSNETHIEFFFFCTFKQVN